MIVTMMLNSSPIQIPTYGPISILLVYCTVVSGLRDSYFIVSINDSIDSFRCALETLPSGTQTFLRIIASHIILFFPC